MIVSQFSNQLLLEHLDRSIKNKTNKLIERSFQFN